MLPDCRKAAARAVALALALAAPAAGQSTSSAAASAAAATASTSLAVTSAAVTIPTSGLLGGSATVTATALLRTSSAAELALKCSAVPTYSTISYNATLANQLKQYLPGFTYNLTAEASSIRGGICAQQISYCSISGCANGGATVTTNFCNNQTMGWNCECSSGPSRLLDWQSPVNQCNTACQNLFATPPIQSISQCQAACSANIGSSCGTASQINISYKVSSPNDQPGYAGNTSEGGSVSSAVRIGAAAVSLLAPLVVAMRLLA